MSAGLSTTTVVQTVTVTSGPALNNQQFQGWYIHPSDSSLEAINCPSSQSLLTTQGYAQCCSIGATTCSTLWTTCVGSNPVGVKTDSCGTGSYCQTVRIFDQLPLNNAPVYSQIICGPSAWAASSIYRNVVTTSLSTFLSTITATASSQQASSSGQSSAGASVQSSIASNTGASATSTAGANSSSNSGSDSSPSKAWIAGAVVGPVLGIAVIALLVWIWRLKRKRKHDRLTSPGTTQPEYYDHNDNKAWAPVGNQAYGMHNYNEPIHEMHGYSPNEVHGNSPNDIPRELPGPEHARPK